MSSKKFVFDIGWVLSSSISGLLIGIILRVILARFFLSSGLGLYAIALLIFTIASMIGAFGIPTATVKYAAEYKEKKELHFYVSSGIINSLLFGTIIALVLFALSGIIADVFNMPDLVHLIRITSFAVPFMLVNKTLFGFLNGLRKMRLYSFGMILSRVIMFIFTIYLILIGWGVPGAILALVLSEIAIFVLLLLISINFFHFTLQNFVKTTKTLLPFGRKLLLAESTHMLDTNIDTLMIGFFLLDKDVGIYAIAIAFSTVLMLIPGAISRVTYPMISEYYSKKAHFLLEETIRKSTKYSFLILSLFSLTLILVGDDIIAFLFPPEFLEAYIPLVFLMVSLILYGAGGSVGYIFAGAGRPDISYKVNGIAVLINLGLNIALIPIFGIIGAAIATSTTYIIRGIVEFCLFEKILDIKIDKHWFVTAFAVVGLMISVFFILKIWINPYLLKIIIIPLYAIIAVFVLLKKEEFEEIKKLVNNIFHGHITKY